MRTAISASALEYVFIVALSVFLICKVLVPLHREFNKGFAGIGTALETAAEGKR